MLGYLLARAGIDVTVLEKHADFLRDFRGDTIHPSTLEVMHQLGLLDELLTLPHQRAESLHAEVAGRDIAGGFHPPADALQIYRLYAAVGVPQLLAQQAAAFPISGCLPQRRFISYSTTAARYAACWPTRRKARSACAASW